MHMCAGIPYGVRSMQAHPVGQRAGFRSQPRAEQNPTLWLGCTAHREAGAVQSCETEQVRPNAEGASGAAAAASEDVSPDAAASELVKGCAASMG
jgi:hypothetical protein